MRPLTVTLGAAALIVGLLNATLCGCADAGGLKVSGPGLSPTPSAAPVFVAEAAGRPPLSRPAAFAPNDSVRLFDLRWRSWGGAIAEATGALAGAWCEPGCRDDPHPVRVTLSGLVRQDRSAYYSRAAVVFDTGTSGGSAADPRPPAGITPKSRSALGDLRLFVPQQQSVPQR
ncbi:hypothetical protein [Streptomyces cinnamoneus]|uniref:hypothetical protein n=1 Tax=Streptomyces cinnamoneus TaxID=53446 RepID=UPI0011B0600F|nr:hypothetical protein [Streptomyces cinnamoneus]